MFRAIPIEDLFPHNIPTIHFRIGYCDSAIVFSPNIFIRFLAASPSLTTDSCGQKESRLNIWNSVLLVTEQMRMHQDGWMRFRKLKPQLACSMNITNVFCSLWPWGDRGTSKVLGCPPSTTANGFLSFLLPPLPVLRNEELIGLRLRSRRRPPDAFTNWGPDEPQK